MARYSKEEPLRPLGYEQIVAPAAATGLTPPPGATYALIQVEEQSIRWRDDGTDPTATVGMLVYGGGSAFWYTGELGSLSFIEVAAGAVVNVSYYA